MKAPKSDNQKRDAAIFRDAVGGMALYEMQAKWRLSGTRICQITHNQAVARGFTLSTWSVAWIKSWWDTEGREAFNAQQKKA